jgi:hypothetical protein
MTAKFRSIQTGSTPTLENFLQNGGGAENTREALEQFFAFHSIYADTIITANVYPTLYHLVSTIPVLF